MDGKVSGFGSNHRSQVKSQCYFKIISHKYDSLIYMSNFDFDFDSL